MLGTCMTCCLPESGLVSLSLALSVCLPFRTVHEKSMQSPTGQRSPTPLTALGGPCIPKLAVCKVVADASQQRPSRPELLLG